jgi:purine-binding chemotaxis protein CheW
MNSAIQELQLACFLLEDKHFAVDIMRAKEIVQPLPLSGLPRASLLIDGLINLRGAVIPVMNLRTRFGMPRRKSGNGKLLIVTVGQRLVALEVDDVSEVISVPVSEIKPPPDLADGVGGAEFLIGVCLDNNQLYMILNIDSLFTAATRFELENYTEGY